MFSKLKIHEKPGVVEWAERCLVLPRESAHIFQNTPQGPRLVMPDFCRTVFPPPIRTHHANPIIGTILALVVGCHRSNVVQRSKSINNKHKKT